MSPGGFDVDGAALVEDGAAEVVVSPGGFDVDGAALVEDGTAAEVVVSVEDGPADQRAGDEAEPESPIDLDSDEDVIDLVASEAEPATVHRPTALQEELAALDALQADVGAAETPADTWLPAESSVVATVRHDHDHDDGEHAEAGPPAAPFRPAPGDGGTGTAAEAVAPGEDVGETDAASPVTGGDPDGG